MKTFTHLKPLATQASNQQPNMLALKDWKQQARIFLKAKRFLLLMMLSLASIYFANAKTQDTCGCKTTVTHLWDSISICYYQHEVKGFDPRTGDTIILCGTYGVDVYMVIQYDEIKCGNDVGVSFKTATIYDGRYNYINNQNCPGPSDPPYICNYNPSDFMYYYKLAQQKILKKMGGGVLNWMYPSGCLSMATIQYPPGAACYTFYGEGPKVGQISGGGPLDQSLKLLPCAGSNCCKFTAIYDSITNHLTYISIPPDVPCPVTLTILTDTIQCRDINNMPVTYIGNVISNSECTSYCNQALGLMFKTGQTGKGNTQKQFQSLPDPLNFNIAPTLAHDFITFSDTKNISKIEIIDVTGKKVYEQTVFDNNTISISKLADGIHYVKIYFADTEIRTIKILKQ